MRHLALALALVATSATAGCFFYFTTSACLNHENCPYPEQCINGACSNPTAYPDFAAACTDDSECGGVECYAGYCYMTGLDPNGEGGACLAGSHLNCTSSSYCGLDGICVIPSEAGVVERGTDTGLDAEYEVEDEAARASLNGVDVVAGHLQIGVDYSESETWSIDENELVFPDIKLITGSLIIKNQLTVETIRFPSLEEVGGYIEIGADEDTANARLRSVDFPSLVRAGGNEFITGGAGQVTISDNLLLSEVRMPLFEGAAVLDIELGPLEGNGADTPNDAAVVFNSLQTTDSRNYFNLQGLPVATFSVSPPPSSTALWLLGVNANLQSAVAGLQTVTEDLWIADSAYAGALSFDNLGQLDELTIEASSVSSIDAPLIASLPTISIEDNPDLTSVTFPNLTSCQSLTIRDNATLDACQVKTIADAAGVPPASVSATGNLGDYDACP